MRTKTVYRCVWAEWGDSGVLHESVEDFLLTVSKAKGIAVVDLPGLSQLRGDQRWWLHTPDQHGGSTRLVLEPIDVAVTRLYRVSCVGTNFLQGNIRATKWQQKEVLYCGPDRLEARAAFHHHKPGERGHDNHHPATRILLEFIEDAGTSDFRDDDPKPQWA